jgi:hypothetical protein
MNRTGARLSPCLTPEVELKAAFALPIRSLMFISVYIFLITKMVFSGMPYLERIFYSISLLTESNALAMSTRRTYVSWSAAWRFCRVILRVEVASEHPRFFMKPACSFRPYFSRCEFIRFTSIAL